MQELLSVIGRRDALFSSDLRVVEPQLKEIIQGSKFLVLGAAGTIGQAVTKEIFKRNPEKLHVVDISENNLTELVRDIRSTFGYIKGEFKTYCLDVGSIEYDLFFNSDGEYDYVLNVSALKHVRSEEDRFTLMRMIEVNILNTEKTINQALMSGVKKYFCVSTDKATNPVNMMGASKRIMEKFLMRKSLNIPISTARFANVAFSDGSLLHSFNQRLEKNQPIAAPNDIKRYFITPQESGELCLISCLLGENRDIFFPKLNEKLHLITFSEIAKKYLKAKGLTPYLCQDEDQARLLAKKLPQQGKWPCVFTQSDTTGEKDFEEFYSSEEDVYFDRFQDLGVIKNIPQFDEQSLIDFEKTIKDFKTSGIWSKQDIVDLFKGTLPEFDHKETGKYLDYKM